MSLYSLAKIILKPLMRVYNRLEAKGLDRFDHQRHYVVVGNHISNVDPFYIAAMYPNRLHYMAKKELFQNRLLAWLLGKLGAFPVNRQNADVGAMKTALRLLKNGQSVGIFPEGTRKDRFDEQAFKQGAAFMAIKTGTPVLPVVIFGANQALPKGRFWIRPRKIAVIFGEPIAVDGEMSMDDLGIRIRKELERLIEEGKQYGWKVYDES